MAQIYLASQDYGTNLVSWPDTLASWTKLDAGDVLASTTTATPGPSANVKVGTIAGDSTSGQHGVSNSCWLPKTTCELCVDVKAGNKTVVYLASGISNGTCYYNLGTGLLGTVGSAAKASMRKLRGGWYRLRLQVQGAGAAATMQISPVDADGATTMTGGDGATVNLYVARPKMRSLYASDNEERAISAQASDEGEQIIAGWDDEFARPINVSPANKARTAQDRVVLTQVIDATGAVGMNLSEVTAADGATAAVKSILIGGKDGSGKQQDAYVGADGRFDITVYASDAQFGAVGAASDVDGNLHGQLRFCGEELDDIHDECIDILSAAGSIKTAVEIMDDWDESDRCKVNPIAGQAGVQGAEGIITALTQRVTIATDDDLVANVAAVTGTEAAAAPTKGIMASVDDGTNARNMKGGADGAVYIEFNSARPGEDAPNDWVEIWHKGHNTGTTSHDEASFTSATIFDSTDVSTYAAWTIYVRNTGANALTDCIVEASDDGTTWYELTVKDADELACETLASGAAGIAYCCSGECHKYVRVRATAGTATTTTTVLVGRY